MTEKEKMMAGLKYKSGDDELMKDKASARVVCAKYNDSPEDTSIRAKLLSELFGKVGKDPLIKPPFRCDYGYNIFVGDNVFVNFDCIFLDAGKIVIGNNCQFGPKTMIFAVTHPIDPNERAEGFNLPYDVMIGDNVWVGGGAIIMPGVRVGANAVIGAGSVVTKDVPAGCVVAGNPARVIKSC